MSGFDSSSHETSNNHSESFDDSSSHETLNNHSESFDDSSKNSQIDKSEAVDESLENKADKGEQKEVAAANNLEKQNPTEQTKEQEKPNAKPSEVQTKGQETHENKPTEVNKNDLGDLSPRAVAENAERENMPQSMEQENSQRVEKSMTNPPSKAEGFGSQAQDKLNEIADKVDKAFGNTPEVVKESAKATARQNIEAGYERAVDKFTGNERNSENPPKTVGVTIKGDF